ncbi:Gti1/Pac2 family-domain-containing protein [Xylariales sp. PMI_506]|nr:Gti1/Pac2 family-domain-containing protein [Xylariales sp. PMI_506]
MQDGTVGSGAVHHGPAPLTPTWQGIVLTTYDALVLFEACLTGRLSHVPRRPHDRERASLITSGNVFIYEEHSSGIKRWTDGVVWSPSRIQKNFLLYRELAQPFVAGEKKRAAKKKDNGVTKPTSAPRSNSISHATLLPTPGTLGAQASDNSPEAALERELVGSLIDSYDFKPTDTGLIKRTISITYKGVQHHLVSYYTFDDGINKRLKKPTESPELRDIVPRPELYTETNWRAPVHDNQEPLVIDGQAFDPSMGLNGNPGMRSMSVPNVPIYQPGLLPGQYMASPSYHLSPSSALPHPIGYLSNASSGYTLDQSMVSHQRHAMAPPSFPPLPHQPRRHYSVIENPNYGYTSSSHLGRSHVNGNSVLSSNGHLSAHGLPSNTYDVSTSGLFDTSSNSMGSFRNTATQQNTTYDHNPQHNPHSSPFSNIPSSSAFDPSGSISAPVSFDQVNHSHGQSDYQSGGPVQHPGAEFASSIPTSNEEDHYHHSGSDHTTPEGLHMDMGHHMASSQAIQQEDDWEHLGSYQQ